MRTTKLALALMLGLLTLGSLPGLGLAEQPEGTPDAAAAEASVPTEAPSTDATASKEDLGFFGAYADFWDRTVEHIGTLDPFGVTGQIPRGFMYVKADLTSFKIGGRYDTKRKIIPPFPPVEFTDGDGNKLLSVDMDLQGQGGMRIFQAAYGITDKLNFYFEVPTVFMDIEFNPVVHPVDDQGNYVSPQYAGLLGVKDPKTYNAGDFLYGTLNTLGRPAPAMKYHGDWLMGDINTGFSWNLYRSNCDSFPCISMALTPRVFLPTGKIPSANSSLTYATGPAVEAGIGGWAASSTQGLDIRLFKYSYWIDILLSSEFTATYGFEQTRKYPTNFVATSMGPTLDYRKFPDLSDLKGDFRFTPGWQLNWNAQLQIISTILTLGAAYGVKFNQDPEIKGDYEFITMVRSFELVGQGMVEALQLSALISLMPLYIPADIAFQYTKMLDGYNTIKYDDYYNIMVKFYIPIWPDSY